VSDLETRLGLEVGSLAGIDLARAQAALDDVSALVRDESAGRTWLDDTGAAAPPPGIKVVTIQAAMRVYNNPDNYTSESVGDYSYQREQGTTSLYLTDDEKLAVQKSMAAAGASGVWSGTGSVRLNKPYAWPVPPLFWRRRRECGGW
jgi:hypothetical protein